MADINDLMDDFREADAAIDTLDKTLAEEYRAIISAEPTGGFTAEQTARAKAICR